MIPAYANFSIPLERVDDEPAQLMTPRAAVLQLLAALAEPGIGLSCSTLFEHSTPGATEAFRAFAHVNGVELVEDTVTVGNRELRSVRLRFANGSWAEVLS